MSPKQLFVTSFKDIFPDLKVLVSDNEVKLRVPSRSSRYSISIPLDYYRHRFLQPRHSFLVPFFSDSLTQMACTRDESMLRNNVARMGVEVGTG